MKLIPLIAVVLLSGCSIILPRPHDPVMFGYLVDTQIALDRANCEVKDWNTLDIQVQRMKVYTNLRKDPQAQTVVDLQEALAKAKDSKSRLFCESILKVQKQRLDVITEAWKGR